jgi:hypothetical protein
MPFEVNVTRSAAYVRFTVVGGGDFADYAELVAAAADEVAQFEDMRVLVDLRHAENRLTPQEQMLIGELAARRLECIYKLASIVRETHRTRNSEIAARAKGLRLRVFTDEDEALLWLLKPSAQAGDSAG